MFVFQHKWFNTFLIVLLMLAPMRGVLATQSSHCDMGVTAVSTVLLVSEYSRPDHPGQEQVQQVRPMLHGTSHDMSTMSLSDSGPYSQNCCCCDGAECGDNCDMGISVSLILQQSSYLPPFVNVQNAVKISSAIQAGEFSPPSRPPRSFS